MIKNGLYVRLDAKVGKAGELEEFLRSALPLAEAEAGTTAWFAVKFSSDSFAIFDAFETASDRQAHLEGKIASALMARSSDLLADPPKIEMWDTLAIK